MISIFNELFTNITDLLKSSFTNIKTSSVYTNTPNSYPFVSMEEIDNAIYEQGIDDGNVENFVEVDFEINIYTKGNKRKTDNNKILTKIDNYLSNLGLIRTNTYIVPIADETLYRVVVRYNGVISSNKTIYRR